MNKEELHKEVHDAFLRYVNSRTLADVHNRIAERDKVDFERLKKKEIKENAKNG